VMSLCVCVHKGAELMKGGCGSASDFVVKVAPKPDGCAVGGSNEPLCWGIPTDSVTAPGRIRPVKRKPAKEGEPERDGTAIDFDEAH